MGKIADARNLPRFCVMCQIPIDAERAWYVVTCSKECQRERDRKDFRRSRVEIKKCRYCNHPASPEERARYAALEAVGEQGAE